MSNFLHPKRRFLLYLIAWLFYLLLAFCAFPVFNISVMLFSIALSMLGAWLYGFSGCIITTALSIPFHYLLLFHYSENPTIRHEAFNLFGISTQLVVSGAVAVLRHTKRKLEQLNDLLEKKVEDRTEELNRLHHYIVQNHETTQVLLSHMLLNDIGNSLTMMSAESDLLLNHLAFEDSALSDQAARLKDMINASIGIVNNLEFIDHFSTSKEAGYIEAVKEIVKHYSESVGVGFSLNIQVKQDEIPKHIQHQLYRITQEAITNAVRHGKTTQVSVLLQMDEDYWCLSVINDGLSMPAKIESGLGMRLMQHRTRQLGGSLYLGKTPDGQTQLQCRIPCSQD